MGLFTDLQGTNKQGANTGGARESKKAAAGVPTNKRKHTSKKREKTSANVSPCEHDDVARGDVITAAGDDVELLPASVEDVARLLPLWVETWQAAQAVPDIRKASPLLFGALCSYIGNFIKQSRILKDTTRTAAGACVASTCNRYNPASVAAAYEIFLQFCGACDKIPFQSDFAAFCGVSLYYVREYVQGLTSAGFNLAKKTRENELNALRRAASRDPVGRLAILNNEYWNGGVLSSDNESASGAALPVGGSFALIDASRLD